MELPNSNEMTIRCTECKTPFVVDGKKVFSTVCESCCDIERKTNKPHSFYKPNIINGKVEYGPYQTNNTVDRWK